MSDDGGRGEGFIDLWPTTLLLRRIPGCGEANRALQRLVVEMDSAHRDLTTDYRASNLMEHAHPAIRWLRDCVNRTVVDYLERQRVDCALEWTIQGWANVNRQGDYHDLHNHPHSYLSGTYYVQVPRQPKPEGRGDLSPGAISFYDPRPQANMNAVRGDAQVNPEHTVMPEPGMMLLWPAFLHHLVHPNLAAEARISISFNIVLKWSDDYLPVQ